MRLLLNYKGINKIMPKVEKYSDIVQFVHENFFLKMFKWNLVYIDSDGDTISLDSDLDVQTMINTMEKDHIKVYIRDCENKADSVEEVNEQKVQECSNSQEPKQISLDIVPRKNEEEQVIELISENKGQASEVKPACSNKQNEPKVEDKVQGRADEHCRWRKQWKKKMEQKMASFIDERLETLIPCLAKKIEAYMKNQEVPIPKDNGETKHDAKCTGCGVSPIIGIRYKCTVCPNFDFCIQCEATIPHSHNMIKMRFIEEPAKEEQMHFKGPWGRCHWKGSWHKNEDENIKIVNKCFKMTETFGGEANDYKQFVEANKDMKFKELSEVYIKQNRGKPVTDEIAKKIKKNIEKVAMYFGKLLPEHEELVKTNPNSNFKEIVSMIKSENKNDHKEEIVMEPKQEIEEVKEEIKEEVKEEVKEEKKQDKKQDKIQEIKEQKEMKEMKEEVKEEKKGWFAWAMGKNTDTKKRNDCLLQMKEFFGDEGTFEYIKFYDQFSNLTNEEIISKYLEKVTASRA